MTLDPIRGRSATWFRRLAWALVALGGVTAVAIVPDLAGLAADEPRPPAKPALPADLDAVPRDAVLIVSARVGELWNSPKYQKVRERLAQEIPELIQQFRKDLGSSPEDVERLSLVIVDPRNNTQLNYVATVKPVDRKRLLADVVPDAKEEKVKDHVLHVSEKLRKAVYFLGERAYVIGPRDTIASALADARKDGPQRATLEAAAGKHTAVVGLNPAPIVDELSNELPPDAEPFKPLLAMQSAVLTLDLGDKAEAHARLRFAKGEDAAKAEKAVQAAVALGCQVLPKGIEELSKDPGTKQFVALLKRAETALKAVRVERKDTAVEVSGAVDIDPPTLGVALAEALHKVRGSASRLQSANNLKQIGIAMHNYHDVNGRFPPAAVYDKDGKPLLSWRVLILPYVEQDALFKEFHLDEPWDSEHNKKLMEKLTPPVYVSPEAKDKDKHVTHYLGFHGKGAFFEGTQGIRIADITDGTSNTILAVEADKAVPWSKPEDLPYDPSKPLPMLGGLTPGGFNAAFCDGSVHFIKKDIDPKTLHLLIQRNDGQVIPGDF